SIDSPEQPIGSFKKAFQAMDFHLIEMCELCDKPSDIVVMCEDVNITGLSFKYKDGTLTSAVITGTKQLAYSNSPLVLNSPNKSVNIDGEFNKMVHLTDPCIAVLKSVIEHAIKYVGGERLQLEMDLKDEKTFDDSKISEIGPAMIGDTTPGKDNFKVPEYSDEDGDLNKTEDVRDDEAVQSENLEPPE
ncbi:MAG: hypothetical protein GWP19_15235, partial [Planctomycetia bacterium]|nr:hypothetical protein [Planctomycetia bacterium]